MRRNTKRLGMLGAGFAMALAGLMGTAQAKGETLVTSQNVNEVAKTIHERKKAKEEININGGLDSYALSGRLRPFAQRIRVEIWNW